MTLHCSTQTQRPQVIQLMFVACATFFLASAESTSSVFINPVLMVHQAVYHAQRVNTHFDGPVNQIHHAVMTVIAGDDDTYTLREKFWQDDVDQFVQAMVKEVNDHEFRDHWTILPWSAIPKGIKRILSVWSFKWKKYPDGRTIKYKAQPAGAQEEDEDDQLVSGNGSGSQIDRRYYNFNSSAIF